MAPRHADSFGGRLPGLDLLRAISSLYLSHKGAARHPVASAMRFSGNP
jgi:hypothetical protein